MNQQNIKQKQKNESNLNANFMNDIIFNPNAKKRSINDKGQI